MMTGRVVDSPEVSNRFLQDIRRTVSDCILNYHYKPFREFANANGLLIDPEAGGPCYTAGRRSGGHGRCRYSPR